MRIADVVDFTPHNLRIPRVSYDAAAMLAAQDLVEALKKPTPNAPFATINYTHKSELRSPTDF